MSFPEAVRSLTPLVVGLLVPGMLVACATGKVRTGERSGPTASDKREFLLAGVPECAPWPDFEARVEQLVARGGSPDEGERLQVRFSSVSGGFAVRLRVDRASGPSERSLVLPTCTEANEAAVLLAALAIDPQSAAPLPEAPEPAVADAAVAEPAVAEAAVAEPAVAQPKAPELPPPDEALPSAAQRERGPWPVAGFFGVLGALDVATLGGPSAGPALELGLVRGRMELSWSGRYYFPRQVTDTPAPAVVDASMGSTALRIGPRLPWGLLRFGAFVGGEVGVLRAEASGLADAHAQRAPWFAGIVAGSLEAVWSRHVSTELGIELGVPVLRPRLALAQQPPFFEMPSVVGRLTFGVRFWALRRP